jgi:serine/threonine protein kinase
MTNATMDSVADLKLYELLDEFMALLRKGQGVPVREFARRYPEHTDQILADFPALLMAEGLKPRLSIVPGGGGLSADASSAEAPELLAGYRVIRQIGQGGMGVVYEAEHPRLSRRLAVKVLLGRKGNATLAERFRREAEAASRLNHPNIVSVFDFGEHNGVQYLAMPLIEGASLDQLVEQYRSTSKSRGDTLSSAGLLTMVTRAPQAGSNNANQPFTDLIGPEADFRKLAQMGADVAGALAHAHTHGTIHRDIKPGNLILDREGKIWITDFGLAKVRDDDSDLSRTGDVIGTPRFMAPEQMRGLCDERSDIYSLGITLYEMASGIRAWDSLNAAQLLKLRASAELPELSEQAPFVPKPLAEIIMKACSYRPEERYQTAKELQIVLNRFAHGQKTGDRRRRSRNGSSMLDRKWVVLSCSLGVPLLAFAGMYALSMGPWAPAQLTTPEALISLVEDDQNREKVVEHLPALIETAMTSKNEHVREKAADLTLQVIEEAMRKSGATQSERKEVLSRAAEITDEYKKSGFVYDKMNHPLTNAVRNLDLATEISNLVLSPEDKLSAQLKVASLGETLRRKLLTQQEVDEFLSLLPVEAQKGPTTQKPIPPNLVRFVMLLESTYQGISTRLAIQHQQIRRKLDQHGKGKSGSLKLPKELSGLKIPKDLQLPPDFKKQPPPI